MRPSRFLVVNIETGSAIVSKHPHCAVAQTTSPVALREVSQGYQEPPHSVDRRVPLSSGTRAPSSAAPAIVARARPSRLD
ncbi:hypothetical protein MTO96_024891 [Rhipicephalus appendiculatus]